MKKAAIYYLYGNQNVGDMAISMGALSYLTASNFSVTGVSRWHQSQASFMRDRSLYLDKFPNISFEGGPIAFERRHGKWFGNVIGYLGAFFHMCRGSYLKNLANTIESSDIVILNGGNLLRCVTVTDLLRLFAFLFPLFVARRRGISYVIFPQSTSEMNWIGKMLVRGIFGGALKVWVREYISLNKFRTMFPDKKFDYAPDMAFYLYKLGNEEVKNISRACEDATFKRIAITVRAHSIGDIAPFSPAKRAGVKQAVIDTLVKLSLSWKLRVTIVTVCDIDAEISCELADEILERNIISSVDLSSITTRCPFELMSLLGEQDLLLGMRLHSIILALVSLTPCAGLFDRSWGLKNPGVLERFALPYRFFGEQCEGFNERVAGMLRCRQEFSDGIKALLERDLECAGVDLLRSAGG